MRRNQILLLCGSGILVAGLAGWGGYHLASERVRHAEADTLALRAQVERLSGEFESLPGRIQQIADIQSRLQATAAQAIPELQKAAGELDAQLRQTATQSSRDWEHRIAQANRELQGKLDKFVGTVAQLEATQKDIVAWDAKVCIERNQGGAVVVPCREGESKRRATR